MKKLKLKIGESYHDSHLNKTMYYMGPASENDFIKQFPINSKEILDLIEVTNSFHKFKSVVGEIIYSDLQLESLTLIKNIK